MDAGQAASAVLSNAGLTQADYLTAKEAHLRAIADEVRGGRQVLLRRYQSAFVEHQLRLQPTSPPVALSPRIGSTVPAVTALASGGDSSGAAAPVVPTYLRKDSPSAPMAAVAPDMLFIPAPPQPAQSAPPRRAMVMTMADAGPRGPATPFQPGMRSVTPQPQSTPVSDAPPVSVPPASIANSQKHTIVADGALAASQLASVPFRTQQRTVTPAPQSMSPVSARVASGTVAADLSAPATHPLTTEEIRCHASAQAGIKLAREPRDTILTRWGFTDQTFAAAEARWSAQFITDGAARSLWMSIYSARLSSG